MTRPMIHLTIDGRPTQVPHGTTILEAASALGIRVPVLCHLPGMEPLTSCFICVVAVQGHSSLVPSCTMHVAEGMVVSTSTDEVLQARRTALELLLSEHRGDCVAPCELACPAKLDIASMCALLKAGRPHDAARSMRARIPFNAILGRICPAFCERVCRRTLFDQPVSIAELQRHAGDAALKDDPRTPTPPSPTGKKVAIVGAGLTGLTAAFYLLQQGHACTLFDANPSPGGMLRYAVGRFRLPAEVLDAELRLVETLGGSFRMSTTLGVDVSLDTLRSEFDAVLLALGAQLPGSLDCEGADLARSALDFLRSVAEGEPVEPRSEMLVIGSAQPAIEAARTAIRLGCRDVTILSLSDPATSPSLRGLHDARAEGVAVHTGVTPLRLEQADSGRLRLTARIDGVVKVLEADEVLAAADRVVDLPSLDRAIPVTAKGIAVDRSTLATSLAGVFAAGECVGGPDYAVRAVAQGRLAALSIDQFLRGETPTGEHQLLNSRLGKLSEDEIAILRAGAHPGNRPDSSPVHLLSCSDVPPPEAARCLQCSCSARSDCALRLYADEYAAHPTRFTGTPRPFRRDASHPTIVYESGKCILCGRCIALARESGEPLGLSFLDRGYAASVGVPFDHPLADGLTHSAERIVNACPTGALAFKTSSG